MAKYCICTNCGFPHEPESDQKAMSKPGKAKNNPFASRGRDKFSELVAKVEEKKQTILERSGTDKGAMVRFEHSDGNKLKPVIVRSKSDIGKKSDTKAAPVVEERTSKKRSTTEKLKLQLCRDYNVAATVIITLLLLVFFRIVWNLGGVIDKI